MCLKYNRFLFSACLSVLALNAFEILPAHAEFKWTPPDEPNQIEDMSPNVSVVDEIDSSEVLPEKTTPEYYEVPQQEVLEVAPPVKAEVIKEEKAEIPAEPELDDELEVNQVTPPKLEPKNDIKIISTGQAPEALSTTSETVSSSVPQPSEHLEPPESQKMQKEMHEITSLVLEPYPSQTPPVLTQKPSEKEESNYETVEGFGTEMPIALVLNQVVPPQFAYSFGAGINPGLRVSWEGGKAWNKILKEALAPHGIDVMIHEKTVTLRYDIQRTVSKNREQETVAQAAKKK